MGIRIIIDTKNTVIRKGRTATHSTRITLPKEWNGKKVSITPIPIDVEPHIDEMLKKDRFIINNAEVFHKEVKKIKEYTYGVFISKKYIGSELAVTII